MSKTDKTRPLWVKVQDLQHWLVEEHDHRYGECDLAAEPVWRFAPEAPVTRCGWVPLREAWWDGQLRCGCPMCSEQQDRRAARRRERAQARRYCAGGWMDEYAGRDD